VDPDYTSRFYIRLRIRDQLGVIRVVGELAEKHGVSIHAILQVTTILIQRAVNEEGRSGV
jgi:hypothetical protein